jgi:predicted PurR-regulated permease PerM
MSEHVVDPGQYIKTWLILVLLPLFSIGAFLTGSRPLAIAVSVVIVLISTVVAMTRFMEIDRLPSFISYIFVTAVVFVGLFFFMVAPDVMKHDGQHWFKPAVQTDQEAAPAAGHR